MGRSSSTLLLGVIGALAALALGGTVAGFAVMGAVMSHADHAHNLVADSGGGSLIDSVLVQPPEALPDFELTDQNGKPSRLSDTNGTVRVVYIGYTSCPDICPTTMINWKDMKRDLGAEADGVTFVMITADPERDTPAVMKEFLGGFDPSFVGLTGTAEQLQSVWVEFGARITREFQAGVVDGGYAVEHPTTLFVLDREGRLAMKIPYLRPTSDAANDLRALLQ